MFNYVTCVSQDNYSNDIDVIDDWQYSSYQFSMTVSFSSATLHGASSFVDAMRSSTHSYHANDAAQHFRWSRQCNTTPFIKAAEACHIIMMFCDDSSSDCYPRPACAATMSEDQLQVTVTPWTCARVNATSLMCTAASKCAAAA